jgi:outer membrane receptor protein involved in Fe transport
VVLFLASFCLAVPASAQVANAVVTGVVTDAQSGVLPGATITVTNAESGVVRTIVTETDGRYRLGGVPPGRYNLTAELPGFANVAVKDITLTIGLEYKRDITMALQGVQETITVTGESPVVETSRTEVAAVVTQDQIETLPTGDRVALRLSLLLPGTAIDTTRAKRSAVNLGAGISTSSTTYLVDGLSNATAISGEQRHDVPAAAIREFQVHTSQVPAQYGQRAGGVVSIATKTGTNELHGEMFDFYRNKALNTLDKFQEEQHAVKPDYSRHQFGFALGGPIVKNRLHYFGTFERTREHDFFTVITGKPEFYKQFEGTYEGGSYNNISFIRGDYQINDKQNLFYRYMNQHTNFFCSGCGAAGINSTFSNNDNLIPRDMHALGHTWVLSNRVLNEFYVMRGTASDRTYLSKDYAPARYQQVTTIPASMGGGQIIGTTRYVFPSFIWGQSQCLPPCLAGAGTHTDFTEVQETLSITTGAHTYKFGGSIQIFPTHEWASANFFGTWTFPQDQYFNPDDPNFSFASLKGATQFQSTFPNVQREMRNHSYAAYVTDEWKPISRLTLNLGLRYDVQTGIWNEWRTQSEYPRPLPYVDFASRGDKNNVAPRLGLAWDVRDDGKSVARLGYGLVYTNITNLIPRVEGSSLKQNTININNPSYPDPYQGKDPANFVSTAPPNITINGNNLVSAPVHTSSAGFSQELRADTAIHLDAIYQKATDIPTDVQVNTRNAVTLVRPLPEWGQIIQRQPIGLFTYKAFLVRLEKRLSHRYGYQLSYTLAKQDSNAATPDTVGIGLGGSITDVYNPGWDIGPANGDRRHAVVLSGAAQLPADIVVGAIWNFRTTTPFSARAGIDLNGDGQNTGGGAGVGGNYPTDYVPGTTKNMGNRDTTAMLAAVNAYRATLKLGPIPESQIESNLLSQLDLRVSKAFNTGRGTKVELIGQVFNVLGRDNLGGLSSQYITNVRSDSFGRILTSLPRQQGEVALRFVF